MVPIRKLYLSTDTQVLNGHYSCTNTTATLTARVVNARNELVPGQTVRFYTTKGSFDPNIGSVHEFTTTTGTKGEQMGIATAQLHFSMWEVGTADVWATDDEQTPLPDETDDLYRCDWLSIPGGIEMSSYAETLRLASNRTVISTWVRRLL